MKKMNVLSVCVLFPHVVQDSCEEEFLEKVSWLMTHLHAESSIEVVEEPDDSDVVIVLLDHYFEPFARQIVELSQEGHTEIWAFAPRGTKVTRIITDEINSRRETQFLYLYDNVEDILRMVGRRLCDLKVTTHIPLLLTLTQPDQRESRVVE